MIELLLLAPEEAVETVTDALIDELGALSVSVEDADADTDAEHALFGEPGMPAPAGGWKRSRIVAHRLGIRVCCGGLGEHCAVGLPDPVARASVLFGNVRGISGHGAIVVHRLT